jgi:hypothetical protein
MLIALFQTNTNKFGNDSKQVFLSSDNLNALPAYQQYQLKQQLPDDGIVPERELQGTSASEDAWTLQAWQTRSEWAISPGHHARYPHQSHRTFTISRSNFGTVAKTGGIEMQ